MYIDRLEGTTQNIYDGPIQHLELIIHQVGEQLVGSDENLTKPICKNLSHKGTSHGIQLSILDNNVLLKEILILVNKFSEVLLAFMITFIRTHSHQICILISFGVTLYKQTTKGNKTKEKQSCTKYML
mgnify:CR=1 FL=1